MQHSGGDLKRRCQPASDQILIGCGRIGFLDKTPQFERVRTKYSGLADVKKGSNKLFPVKPKLAVLTVPVFEEADGENQPGERTNPQRDIGKFEQPKNGSQQ